MVVMMAASRVMGNSRVGGGVSRTPFGELGASSSSGKDVALFKTDTR